MSIVLDKAKRYASISKWRAKNYETVLAWNRGYYKRKRQDPEMVKRDRLRKNQSDRRRKVEVFTHYSNGIPQCNCCGETIIEFLALDHINNDGAKDRAKGLTGKNIYSYVRKRNYPKGFQVLCHNCNQAKGITRNHVCPHKEKQP